jgi:phosphoglycolate phosphatase
MSSKLVIFDLDGTLLDTLDDLSAAVNYAMQQQGFLQHTREEYRMMVGHGARNLMMQALPIEHRDETTIDSALADFKAFYHAHIDVFTKPFPGIPELLKHLHQKGVKLAVASNKFQEGTEHLIKEFFPDIPFVAILGNRPGYPLKPAPEVVREVLRKAGLQKEKTSLSPEREVGVEAIMVGDSDTDMETAANGGIRGIAVNWGYRNMREWANKFSTSQLFEVPQGLRAQEPHHIMVVDTVEELQKILLS